MKTKKFALAVVRLVEQLPVSKTSDVVGRQLLRSATSVAANYRASCRARSRREFIAKMGIVEEEADESQFWLEVLVSRGIVERDAGLALHRDAGELVAMTVASIRTARRTPRSSPQSAIRNPQCL
jgi:four helix bundle protein